MPFLLVHQFHFSLDHVTSCADDNLLLHSCRASTSRPAATGAAGGRSRCPRRRPLRRLCLTPRTPAARTSSLVRPFSEAGATTQLFRKHLCSLTSAGMLTSALFS